MKSGRGILRPLIAATLLKLYVNSRNFSRSCPTTFPQRPDPRITRPTHVHRVVFNDGAAWLDVLAHQRLEDPVRLDGVLSTASVGCASEVDPVHAEQR
jgi:hypothetical protein